MVIEYWIIGWIMCGIVAYGRTLAHFYRHYPTIADEARITTIFTALFQGLCGPVGLLISLVFGRHGFMWKFPPKR